MSIPTPSTGYQIENLRPALRALGRIDNELKKELRRNLRQELKPVQQAARAKMPAGPPLSGFAHKGRTGWSRKATTGIVMTTSGRTKSGALIVMGLMQKNAAGIIYDMAGRRGRVTTPQGAALLRNLPGRASRAMWPAVEESGDVITAAVEKLVNGVTDALNREGI